MCINKTPENRRIGFQTITPIAPIIYLSSSNDLVCPLCVWRKKKKLGSLQQYPKPSNENENNQIISLIDNGVGIPL